MTETLSEYVQRIMAEKGLSSADVEHRSHGTISQSYVNRIKNGIHKNPTTPKLKALAQGIDVSESELFAVSRGIIISAGEFHHELLVSINTTYEGLSKIDKQKADYLLEITEREIRRLEAGG